MAWNLFSGLFGNRGNQSSQSAAPQQSTYNVAQTELDPILKQLLAAIDRSGQQQWGNTFRTLQDNFQRRGMGGSGIEFQNMSEAARQHALDIAAQKQASALDLYKMWLSRRQQELEQSRWEQGRADAASAQNKSGRAALWGSAGSIFGSLLGK